MLVNDCDTIYRITKKGFIEWLKSNVDQDYMKSINWDIKTLKRCGAKLIGKIDLDLTSLSTADLEKLYEKEYKK